MLQATFADRRLTTLSIIRATLTNSGGKPLTQSDIEEPVSFAFREGVTVLDVDLVDKSPGVKPTRVSEASSLDWEFVSLNQGEHFTLQFLVDGHVRELPAVSGRILGIPEIQKIDQSVIAARSKRRDAYLAVWAAVLMLSLAVVVGGLQWFSHRNARAGLLAERARAEEDLARALQDRNETLRRLDVLFNIAEKVRTARERGRLIFETKCAICHEQLDRFHKKIGPGLLPLRSGLLPSGKEATRESVMAQVDSGGSGMPAFEKILSAQEKDDVVTYTLDFNPQQ